MAGKLKLTKTELKQQQEMLGHFRRFLPPLQLKKQLLQLEIQASRDRLGQTVAREEALLGSVAGWAGMFRDEAMMARLRGEIRLARIELGEANIAGVSVPTFRKAEFTKPDLDPMATEWHWDDAAESLRRAAEIRAERAVLAEQERRLSVELRITSQRVNLFEKVKIPECRESIHRIRVHLGDQETSAIVRAKMAQAAGGDQGEEEA